VHTTMQEVQKEIDSVVAKDSLRKLREDTDSQASPPHHPAGNETSSKGSGDDDDGDDDAYDDDDGSESEDADQGAVYKGHASKQGLVSKADNTATLPPANKMPQGRDGPSTGARSLSQDRDAAAAPASV
jgi:hypothetical protein